MAKTPPKNAHKFRGAFSLIELMIVVMIIGIVYTLAIGNFQKIGESKTPLTLKTLKEYLKEFKRENSVEFLCLDRCSSCDVFVDGEKVEDLKGSFDNFLDDSIEIYRYEYGIGAVELEPKIYFNEEGVEDEVCFSYSLDLNGVGEQVLVEFKDKAYDFTPYLSSTVEYNSLQEAVDAKDELVQEVLR